MDDKSICSDMVNKKKKQYDKVNSWTASNLKSIKTQTEESSFLFNSCSCHRKIFNNFTNDEMSCCHLKRVCGAPSIMCVCRVCSQSQNNGHNGPFHPYPLPFYAPYGHCNVPPSIPVQWYHSPFLNNSHFSNSLNSSVSAHHRYSGQSVVENENCKHVSSVYDLIGNTVKSKPMSSSICSESNTAKNNESVPRLTNINVKNLLGNIKRGKHKITNLLNALEKIKFKSDTDISLTTNLKAKRSYTLYDNYRGIGPDANALNKIRSSLICSDKGDNSCIKNNDKDILKSPVYKYADIKINELSESLKSIKDNVCKLSTKASELNIIDSYCDNDNCKNYFENIYSELDDEDLPGRFVYVTKKSNNRINFNNDGNTDNVNGDAIRTRPVKQNYTLSMLSKEGGDLFTEQFLSENNSELPERSNITPTIPSHDTRSTLIQNKVFSSVEPTKIKSSKNVKDRISARIISPERSSSNFKSLDKEDGNNVTSYFSKKKLNNLSERCANISYMVNCDAFNGNDSFTIENGEDDESNKSKRSNGNVCVSTSEYFYCDTSREKPVYNNYSDSGNVNVSDAHENSCFVPGRQLLFPAKQSQENAIDIENWLEKNAQTSDQCHGVKILSKQKKCDLNSLSGLEILSKITEEDEDKMSSLSESSEPTVSLLITDKGFFNNNSSKCNQDCNVKNVTPYLHDNLYPYNIDESNEFSDADSVYLIQQQDALIQ